MRYETLLILDLRHDFYANGDCPDFEIRPTPATRRRLVDHHCLVRETPNGLQVVTAVRTPGAGTTRR